jgi:hypothetical protein
MLNYKNEIQYFDIESITIEEVSLKIKRLNKLIFNLTISMVIIILYISAKIFLIYFELIQFRFFPIILIDLALYEFFRLSFIRDDLKNMYLVLKVTYDIKLNELKETT